MFVPCRKRTAVPVHSKTVLPNSNLTMVYQVRSTLHHLSIPLIGNTHTCPRKGRTIRFSHFHFHEKWNARIGNLVSSTVPDSGLVHSGRGQFHASLAPHTRNVRTSSPRPCNSQMHSTRNRHSFVPMSVSTAWDQTFPPCI